MPVFKVFFTGVLEKKLEKAEKNFQLWVEKMLDRLAENPFAGKPLGTKWIREKKFGKYRIYYLVYEKSQIVYLVNLSDKKDQQAIINSIKLLLGVYKKTD